MVHHGQEVASFRIDLNAECTLLQNTCEKLLENLVSRTIIDSLINPTTNESGKAAWSLHDVQQALGTLLNQRTVVSFLENIEQFNELIESLQVEYPEEV